MVSNTLFLKLCLCFFDLEDKVVKISLLMTGFLFNQLRLGSAELWVITNEGLYSHCDVIQCLCDPLQTGIVGCSLYVQQ